MVDAPGGWELKRSIDQLREDIRDDLVDIKRDVNGVGSKFDNLDQRYVTKAEHTNLERRVGVVEEKTEKRTDRNITIWLAIGVAIFSALVSIAGTILGVVLR